MLDNWPRGASVIEIMVQYHNLNPKPLGGDRNYLQLLYSFW